MRASQFDALCCAPTPKQKAPPSSSSTEQSPELGEAVLSVAGASVSWHSDLQDVPFDEDAYTMVVANEFFDALPIHQFEAAGGRWHERLVGLAEAAQTVSVPSPPSMQGGAPGAPASSELCFVRSPSRTAPLQVSRAVIATS